jgi:putative ABC transport system ATP-binding protein
LDGRDLSGVSQTEAAQIRNRDIGFVFQAFHLLPRLEAWENVALPLIYRGATRAEQRERAIEALHRVGLADRARNKPAELSGGQRQRVAIARALVGTPRIVLADEPTGSLDSLAAAEVIDLFDALVAELGVTLVVVTHDPSVADRCQRQVALLDGRVVRDSARSA